MSYAALWCKSNFSFLEGASHPKELVCRAAELGLGAVAITDRDGVHGVVQAHLAAEEHGVKLLVGSQVSVDDGTHIVLLAADLRGYQGLCLLLSRGRLRSEKGHSSVSWDEVADAAPGCFALWGGPGSALIAEQKLPTTADQLCEAFGDRLFALITRHRRPEDLELETRVRRRAARLGLARVAGLEVLYHHPQRQRLQDTLTCIRHGVRLHTAGRLLNPNAEHALLWPDAFYDLFADDLEAVENTYDISQRCAFSMGQIRYVYPSEDLPGGLTSARWLHQLSFEGARWRYGGLVPDQVAWQLERELALIEELDYPGYFLTMWEIVEFCRAHGIICQGRGSAANSVVCFCLGITAVDPVKMDLLFERFLSRERPDPPDIDLDIEHNRREEVIQYVYEKYGRSRAAMVANVIRYRPRSALREVGKVLGVPETALDRVSKLVHWDTRSLADVLEHAGIDGDAELAEHLLDLVNEIQGFPRHLSIHPGGFLLGHEPVHHIVPLENATMKDRTVVQWDKDDVEALGLFKVDLLGLGALTLVHCCLDLLREHRGLDLTLATIPAEDPETYDMICAGDTVGVFQIESRAQMAMLPRLRPRTFYDLVIEVSIVRPGPIAGDMVHPYLRRRDNEEAVTYPHPCLEPVLRKTLGVPLFQEQVIKLAMAAADYTPGEADQLRRDMAAWRKTGRIERHRQRLVSRMMKKGIKREFAERVFEQICGFGEYGFPESHAASFALIAYATAWLKCHHPAAFTCALLNAQPMGFYTPATIIEDAKRHGVRVDPVDVRQSNWQCTLERLGDEKSIKNSRLRVRVGMRFVKGMSEHQGNTLVLARTCQPFVDLEDLIRRTRMPEKYLVMLAEAGALEKLPPGLSRRQALWEVRRLVREAKLPLSLPRPQLPPGFEPLSLLETITWDYRATSHSTLGHPLGPLRPTLRAIGLPDAHTLNARPHGSTVHYAGLVINRQRPGTAGGVVFMTMEDETGVVNLIFWPDIFEKNALLTRTEAFFGVSGELQSEKGVVHLVVKRVWLPKLEAPRAHGKSRDFH